MSIRDDVYHALSGEETIDPNPPFSCIPPGDAMWLSLKTTRILNLIIKELEEMGNPYDLNDLRGSGFYRGFEQCRKDMIALVGGEE